MCKYIGVCVRECVRRCVCVNACRMVKHDVAWRIYQEDGLFVLRRIRVGVSEEKGIGARRIMDTEITD